MKSTDKLSALGDNTLGELIAELNDEFVQISGSNATDPGVTAMLGKLIDANKVLKVDGSNATDPGVTAMLGKLIDANKVLKVDGSNATDPGVTAMLGKLIDANKVLKVDGSNATDPGVTAMLGKLKGDNVVVKINASNLTDAANQKAFAEAILPAKDGNKSILVAKLEGFLAENAKAYSSNTKTAKELLVPSAADLVQDHDFKQGIGESIKEMAVSSNLDFQKNVREVMSQPSFDISPSDDAALNWTW